MLDCERWTLTHSSGWADVVEFGLALVLALARALALWLGLAAKRAVREAEAVAEVWDDDGEPDDPEGEPEGVLDGEFDPEGDGEPDLEAADEGDAGVVVVAGEAGELEAEEDGLGLGVGVFDGFGVGVDGFGVWVDGFGVWVLVGVGVGVGEGVLEAGSTWQLVSVFALALVEVPGLSEAAVSLSAPAWAVPGEPASTPRMRKPPPSTLSAVTRTCTRTCARRMRIALSPLLVRVTVCSSWVRRRLGDGWVSILISGCRASYACTRTPGRGRAALAGRRPGHGM